MDKTRNKLLSAALEKFVENGYKRTTTKEIAYLAGVAEMTLFRHFTSKSNLFVETLTVALHDFVEKEKQIIYNMPFFDFFQHVLHNKLILASKNKKLLQMVIRENSYGNIPEHLKIIDEIQRQSFITFQQYLKINNNFTFDSKYLTDIFIGIIIRYVLMEEYKYCKLSIDQQKEITLQYAKIFTK